MTSVGAIAVRHALGNASPTFNNRPKAEVADAELIAPKRTFYC